MSAPHPARAGSRPPATRPVDVDTAFWLWIVAVPLVLGGIVIDAIATAPDDAAAAFVALLVTGVGVVSLAVLVPTFAVLMRQGYRWARTVLTGGGLASAIISLLDLAAADHASPVLAVAQAVCAIVGSVLVVGGMYLVHRKDASAWFARSGA